jgi:membrane protease YdiL (CAAX protease family)
VPLAGLLAAAVFTLAHVSFRSMSADPRQLLLAFVLGIYYAVAYHRTGSLLAPVLAHNLVDGGIVTAEWLVTVLAFPETLAPP